MFGIISFSHLSDKELTELIGVEHGQVISFSDFNSLIYKHNSDIPDTNNLETCDPEINSLNAVSFGDSDYVYEEEFVCSLSNMFFTILLYNINSIPRNLEKFLLSVSMHENRHLINLMAFCETKLSDDIEHLYHIEGYTLITNNRNSYGGGVCLYLKNEISFNTLWESSIKNDVLESLFVRANFVNETVTVGVLYRRPNGSILLFLEVLENILENLDTKNRPCIIMGDFNINLLHEDNRNVKAFVELFSSYGYSPCINKPTRIGKHSATLLDHIWTNDTHIISKAGIILTDVSDHLAPYVNCRVSTESVDRLVFRYRDYNNVNRTDLCAAMQEELSRVDLDEFGYERVVGNVMNVINRVIKDKIPLKSVKINRKSVKNPWMTSDILNHINEKRKLYKRFLKRPITYGEQYRACRNRVNRMIEEAKQQHYCRKFNCYTGDGKKTWKVINEIINSKIQRHATVDQLSVDEVITSDPKIISNYMNNYFSCIGSDLSKKIPSCNKSPLSYLPRVYPEFTLNPTTTEEIENIIKTLRDSAAGYDDIHIRAIKLTASVLSPILSKLINKSFQLGIFPSVFKMSKVTPIFKGGNASNVSDYRPVSVLPSVSKIYEKAMYDRLYSFFQDNNILIQEQYGFRKALSPNLALRNLIEYILQAQGNGRYSISVFLDLKKAFDTLDHSILLNKLKRYGIKNVKYDWFNSYLSNRCQFTVVNNVRSSVSNISTGVPQGSILGPLLFLTYINDIVESSSLLKFILFADDTNLTLSGSNLKNISLIINEELNKVAIWLQSNKLSLNINKTHYIVFAGNKQNDYSINLKISNKNLERSSTIKYLGIWIDDKLSWKAHVDHIKSKLSKTTGILHKIKHLLNVETLLLLYYSIAYPYLQYCNLVWGMATTITTKPLQLLQKRIIRIITKKKSDAHTHELFKQQKILKIQDIYTLECLKYVHKCLHSDAPTLHTASHVHTLNTRHRQQLRPAFPHTQAQKRFVNYHGCIQWNNLPNAIRNCNNKDTFKINLKKHLINMY